jgi:transposase
MSEEQRLIAELLKRLAALEADVERLKAENAELRRRLEKNSQNRHKPPSSDSYRKKSVRPGLPKQ